MSDKVEQTVPDIGDFTDVEVIEIHVAVGDVVAVEDPLITIETDKASMDVPATTAGTIASVEVSQGDRVSEGSLIAAVTAASGDDGEKEAPAESAQSAPEEAAADEPAAAAGESQSVLVPDIGDFADVDVIEVHVSSGDSVAAEDPLITLETDKASMDVPAPAAGTIESVAVAAGDKVSEGDLVLVLQATSGGAAEVAATPAETPVEAPAATAAPAAAPAQPQPPAPAPASSQSP